uniref:ArsR family transcriptional regulator n=1 Tax=candidate division WOR-3 bacterium TaxID=2052148 RepID=A0A7C3F1T6_UNCW3
MRKETLVTPDAIFAALAHPVRLETVAMLAGGERCVCEIARHFQQERSVVSRHLRQLARAGIVEARTEGRKVIYRLTEPRALELIDISLAMVRKWKKK